MKFSDGNWQTPENLTVLQPMHAFSVERHADRLMIYASLGDAATRGGQINAKLFTITLFSPHPDIIGVRVEHFRGGFDKGPHFELSADPGFAPELVDDGETASLTSGDLAVRIPKSGEWRIDFLRGGKPMTASAHRSSGYAINSDDAQTYIFERLDLGVGGLVYGLGERFTAFVKNGQSVEIWNRDGGANTEQGYKNIPFFLTNRGWGVFVNHPGRVEFEIGSEKVSKAQFSALGEALEYYVINGPSPKQVLERYTRLTGRPVLPPAWSFGLWLTTSFTTDYDEKTVTSFLDGMRERDIPLHVFHFDCFWMRGLHWCDFEWDPEMFPDPQAMLARYKARGLKICVWINSYIAQQSSLFEEGKAKGYLLKRPDGSVWQWDRWQPGQAVVDFTNPDACTWFAACLKRLVAMGVDCFKTDFGERIPTDVVYFDGSSAEDMHNYYTYLYNKTVFEALEEARGKGEAMVFARSATVGGQKFPVHWGGDCYSDFDAMAESLRGGLSLGLSGFGYWSHDIGGFEYTASADVYKRWCAFGLLSSHSRLHGSKSYRVPWLYDQEAVDVLRFFTRLKCRLMPYIFAKACEPPETGVPVMRAMLLEFPDDPACETLDRQYMLGDAIMVAPVLNPEGEAAFYLPEGRWTHLLTGEAVEGGKWRRETHGFMSLPVYVRPASLIAFGADDSRPDYDYAAGATYHLFGLADGASASATLYAPGGRTVESLTVSRAGNQLTIAPEPADRPWRLCLRGLAVAAVNGATKDLTSEGAFLTGRGFASAVL